MHETKIAESTLFPSGSVLVIDRGYANYSWLHNLDCNCVLFVTRLKSSGAYIIKEDNKINDKHAHIISDQKIVFTTYKAAKNYSRELRLVTVYDALNDVTLELLTNNFTWTAETISQLYKARWDVEIFFKH